MTRLGTGLRLLPVGLRLLPVGLRLLGLGLALLVAAAPHLVLLRLNRATGLMPALVHRAFLALFGVRVRERGAPPEGAALILSNHVSWLDIAVIGSRLPLSFVAKSEIAGWPVVGALARLQRTVFIDRARRTHTASVNSALAARLAAGDRIVLFAEGTTGDGNRVLPFRASLVGAARAALTEGGLDRVHLQPLAIAYTRRHGLPVTRVERPDIAWYGDTDLAPHLAAFLRGGHLDVELIWGEPVVFEAGSDRKRATARAEATVRRLVRAAQSGREPTILPEPDAGREPEQAVSEPILIRARTA